MIDTDSWYNVQERPKLGTQMNSCGAKDMEKERKTITEQSTEHVMLGQTHHHKNQCAL